MLAGEAVVIALASACGVVILGLLGYWVWRFVRKRRKDTSEYEQIDDKVVPTKAVTVNVQPDSKTSLVPNVPTLR